MLLLLVMLNGVAGGEWREIWAAGVVCESVVCESVVCVWAGGRESFGLGAGSKRTFVALPFKSCMRYRKEGEMQLDVEPQAYMRVYVCECVWTFVPRVFTLASQRRRSQAGQRLI